MRSKWGWRKRAPTSGRPRAGGASRDRGSYVVLALSIVAASVIAVWSIREPTTPIPGQPIPFIVGLVLAWGGTVLRVAAFVALGRYFTFRVQTRAEQPVVSTGPYRILRHPGYTGVWLFLVGLGLMCGTWIALGAALVLPLAGLVFRIRIEERALIEDLGEKYVAFAATRKRLIPFVW